MLCATELGFLTGDIVLWIWASLGYETAGEKALELLNTLIVHKTVDIKDEEQVSVCLKSCIASKQYGLEDILTPLITKSCISVLPANRNMFSVENVRVAKVLGGSVGDSSVVAGAVLTRGVEGTVRRAEGAKVAVFTCDLETAEAETKGTVLLKSAAELTNYTKSEEAMMEAKIKALADAGVGIIAAAKFGEVAMHFVDKYRIMAIRCTSKFDLRRVARTTKAMALAKLVVPTPDELGDADLVEVREIGSTKCIVFSQRAQGSRISTILVRASTQNMLDDIDRAVDDAVNVYKGMTRDARFVGGAGASEMELSRLLREFARSRPGLDQYAIDKFADALEVVPRILAETSGCNATDVVSNLMAAHAEGRTTAGVNVDDGSITDVAQSKVYDLFAVKYWALRLATEAVCTILRVDQIIMAKTAGGPKPRDMQAADGMDDAP